MRFRIDRVLWGMATALASLVLGAGLARAADLAPDALVKNVTTEVLGIVAKDPELRSGHREKTIALVEEKVLPHFDFSRMTALAMATYWDKATPEQKTRLIKEFKTLLVRTYASSIAAYHDKRFKYRPLRASPEDTDVTVSVRVLQPGRQAVQIEYDMEKTAAGWKVWDVRVGGISLVLNYRTEFGNIARESGVEGVIRSVAAKNTSLGSPGKGGEGKK